MRTAKLLDRIKKLQALATSPNEAEALAAATKAEALMREHAISQMELDGHQLEADDPLLDQTLDIGAAGWRAVLGFATATFCHVYALRWKGRRDLGLAATMQGWGRRSDLEVWHWLYDLCERYVQHEAKQYTVRGPHGRRELSAFRMGCARGIASKLDLLRQKADERGQADGSTALVLARREDGQRKALEEGIRVGGAFRTTAGRGTLGARQRGFERGRAINPSRGGLSAGAERALGDDG